jgi:hypothetical protein
MMDIVSINNGTIRNGQRDITVKQNSNNEMV